MPRLHDHQAAALEELLTDRIGGEIAIPEPAFATRTTLQTDGRITREPTYEFVMFCDEASAVVTFVDEGPVTTDRQMAGVDAPTPPAFEVTCSRDEASGVVVLSLSSIEAERLKSIIGCSGTIGTALAREYRDEFDRQKVRRWTDKLYRLLDDYEVPDNETCLAPL